MVTTYYSSRLGFLQRNHLEDEVMARVRKRLLLIFFLRVNQCLKAKKEMKIHQEIRELDKEIQHLTA